MFGSDVLEIIIGLAFVFWLFSLLCSTLTEGIARFLALRSGTLWVGIRNMLEEGGKTSSANGASPLEISVNTLYGSALFDSLSKSSWFDWVRVWRILTTDTYRISMPSYVPPRTFALALFDTLLNAQSFLFAVDSSKDLVDGLDKCEATALETDFRKAGKTLGKGCQVHVQEAGSQWKIVDTGPRAYLIKCKQRMLSLYKIENGEEREVSTFSLGQNLSTDELDKANKVPQALRIKIRDQGVALGGQVLMDKGKTGSQWDIVDNSPREYLIKEEDGKLNVYNPGKEPDGSDEDKQALADMRQGVRSAVEGLTAFSSDADKQNSLKDLKKLLPEQSSGEGSLAFQPKARQTFKDIEKGIDKISSEYLKGQLKPILRAAQDDAVSWEDALAKARIGVEAWFDDRMARVTGWYDRNTRTIVFCLAILVTILFNVDTLAIADALSADATLRETVAAEATDVFERYNQTQPADNAEVTSEAVISNGHPITATMSISETLNTLDQLGLPIGWVVAVDAEKDVHPLMKIFVTELNVKNQGDKDDLAKARRYRQQWPGYDLEAWGKKLAGLFFTVVMLSLGAPFWFDVLGKLSNLRATGKVPKVPDTTNTNTG